MKSTVLFWVALFAVVAGVPLIFLAAEALRTGRPFVDVLRFATIGARRGAPAAAPASSAQPRGRVDFLDRQTIGEPAGDLRPWITHVAVCDLDANGLNDVLVCDANANQVSWIEQSPKGTYTEHVAADGIKAPAHVTACDVDKDGDLDLLVAKMGVIFPNNDRIGSVIALVNDGRQQFAKRALIDNVARVTDIEPGDFDGDGDVDLAVGQFGYNDGEIRWMENLGGDWQFESHNLQNLSGAIHTPVADLDGDGDLDIAALVSQEWEEVYVFENDGHAQFAERLVYGSGNEDFGSSGIALTDLDQDGDIDILYTNGDAFDYLPPTPRPWHGVQWLENKGGLTFEFHRIADFLGAYSANAVDVDHDGDLDIAAVSAFCAGRVQPEESVTSDATLGGMSARARAGDGDNGPRARDRASAVVTRTEPSEEALANIQRMREMVAAGKGDAANGAKVFAERCAKCHRLFDEGAQVGPDLTQSNRLDREYLLTNIVDPNQAVHTRYAQYVVRTASGEELNGVITERTATDITLVNANRAPATIAMNDIEEIRNAGTSLMPEGLLAGLSPENVRDLFAYLQSERPDTGGAVPAGPTMVWFENDGHCRFVKHEIATAPTHLVVLVAADMDQDGWCDFVTGGMNAFPPYDEAVSRVMLWHNDWPGRRGPE